ncbi:MAG: hypothetical protein M3436_04535 [Pseudomonadota bacterium]|nr:hypothetical protein [Pseudomonadota bacterium]
MPFTIPTLPARREGMRKYDTFMSHVGRTVAAKWLGPGRHIDAEVLKCPDFSALTDLSQCAERVRTMAIVPFTRRSIIPLAIAELIPMVPVVATVIPLRDVLLKVVKLLPWSSASTPRRLRSPRPPPGRFLFLLARAVREAVSRWQSDHEQRSPGRIKQAQSRAIGTRMRLATASIRFRRSVRKLNAGNSLPSTRYGSCRALIAVQSPGR